MARSKRFTVGWDWVWRGWYDPPQPWGAWVFSRAHDSDSLWWCVMGFQVCVRIRGRHYP